jgi:hypothetical protein
MFYCNNELCLEDTDQCYSCERANDGLCPFLIFTQTDFMCEYIPEMEHFNLDFDCPKFTQQKVEILFIPENNDDNVINMKRKKDAN